MIDSDDDDLVPEGYWLALMSEMRTWPPVPADPVELPAVVL